MPFRSLGLDPRILQAIQEFGYTEPTPIQAAAIPQILTGQDLIGIAQTGTGKTAAFTLPILTHLASLLGQGRMRSTKALILAPTRELVAQIQDNIKAYAKHLPIRVATIFGGVGERPQIQALREGTDIIIATPGRLIDLMGQRHGNFSNLECLVLDEADRMLDMGFLPSIKRIVKALPSRRQTLMFSATLSKEIEALTHEFQQRPKIVQIGKRSNPAESVTQLVYEVPQHLKSPLLLHLLVDPSFNTVLVFAKMKHGADRIARYLESYGVKTATLHSNRTQNQRLRALADFKSGAVRVLIATDIAARGIDVDGITHVINYDFPKAQEDYIHRIGRTGRAQAIGDAISFITKEDQGGLKALERFIGRGLIRKVAEGFDYTASAGANHDVAQRERKPRPQNEQGQSQRNSRPNRSNPINPRGRDSNSNSNAGPGSKRSGGGNRTDTSGLRRGEGNRGSSGGGGSGGGQGQGGSGGGSRSHSAPRAPRPPQN